MSATVEVLEQEMQTAVANGDFAKAGELKAKIAEMKNGNSEVVSNYPLRKVFDGYPKPDNLNLFSVPAPLDADIYDATLTGRSMVFEFPVGNEKFNSCLVEVEIANIKPNPFIPVSDKELLEKFRKGLSIRFEASDPTTGKNGRKYTTIKTIDIV